MQGSDPVTGKMPVPQILLVKGQHYIVISMKIEELKKTSQ